MNAPAAAPRGFTVDRSDGRPPLPGSLHANRRIALWLAFREPGRVEVFTGKAELGQGILTALQLIAAEELDVPLAAVRVHAASTVRGPDEGMTSGSLSVQDSGSALRQACAEVRALALARAAARAGLGTEAVAIHEGRFVANDGRDLGDYTALLAGVDLDIECTGQARPKAPEARRLYGRTHVPRVDLADKVFGRARFIHDLAPEGLLHGRVLHPPTLTATFARWPAEVAAALPAGVTCWADGRFVAVVAERERDAEAAAAKLASAIDWTVPEPLPDEHALAAFLRSAPHQTTVPLERGFTEWPHDEPPAGRQHRATYLKPYLAHASIGPSCALARWDGRHLEVWTHSQGIHNLRDDLVLALAGEPVPPAKSDITLHHVEGAGCYGHNGADDVALDAVLLALRHPGRPVRVLWSRAEELTTSPLGPAHLVELTARLGEDGRITHWQHELWASGYSSRPGRAPVPTLLAASERERATALPLPVNAPLASGGGADRNAVPGYALPAARVVHHRLTVMPLRTSAMRALGGFANVFAIESFIDELAQLAACDPLEFRRRHLDDPRALAVLEAVTSRSAWWSRREGAWEGLGQGLGTEGLGQGLGSEGLGQGLAWARYKNLGAWCAAIAQVEVTDRVLVRHLELAVDVGMVVDLDGVINQVEGGALQSMSWTLKERVRFGRDGLTSRDWASYPVLRFDEVPALRVHVLDRPGEPPLGAGECAQGPVAAALANAVHDAVGLRVRELPLDAEALLRAAHARG